MPTSPSIYVKACINGARTPDQHPNLPVTPDQLAAAAVQAAPGRGARPCTCTPRPPTASTRCTPTRSAPRCGRPRGGARSAAGRDDGVLGAARRRRAAAGGRGVDGAARLRVAELARTRLRRSWRTCCSARGSASRSVCSTPRRPRRGPRSDLAQHCMRVMIELQARRGRRRRRRHARPGARRRFARSGAAARARRELLAATGTRRGAWRPDPDRHGGHPEAARRFDGARQRRAGVRGGALLSR